MKRFLSIALIANLLSGTAVLADEPAATTQPTKDQQQILTYDVSDLLSNTQDYPLNASAWAQNNADQSTNGQPQNGSGGGGGSGLFNGTAQAGSEANANSNVVTANSLIAVIKQMTSQNDLNISQLGKTLIVQASPEIQAKIQGMLNSMHSQQAEESGMVCARMFWVSLNPSEVASIFDKAKPGNNAVSMPEVPDTMIDASHLYCQAQTMCFSGQMIYVVAGRAQTYVSNLTPIVGSNSVGLAPTISKALSGATLQIRPQLIGDGRATIDVASVVNEAAPPVKEILLKELSLTQEPVAQSTTQPAAENASVESVNVLQQEFHTTVRLPVGKKILIGGMTLEPAAKDQAGRQLFLAMEVDAVQ